MSPEAREGNKEGAALKTVEFPMAVLIAMMLVASCEERILPQQRQQSGASMTHRVYESWPQFMEDVEAGRIETLLLEDPGLSGTYRARSLVREGWAFGTFEVPGFRREDVSDEDWVTMMVSVAELSIAVHEDPRIIASLPGNRWVLRLVLLILLAACAAWWKHTGEVSAVLLAASAVAVLSWSVALLFAAPWILLWCMAAAGYILAGAGGIASIVSSLRSSGDVVSGVRGGLANGGPDG